MRNTLPLLLLLCVLFQKNICFGDEWFYGTWYFDRDFTSNQIDSIMANKPDTKANKEYFAEIFHSGEFFKNLDGTIYEFSSTNATFIFNQKADTQSYKILERPNTNEVILKYEGGARLTFCLTNGLLELKRRRPYLDYYYSRKPAITVTNY